MTVCHWWKEIQFGLCWVNKAILTWHRCGVNNVPMYGWPYCIPNYRRWFLTISGLIRLLFFYGVAWAVSSAVWNQLLRWVSHINWSCRHVMTCRHPFLGLWFVVSFWGRLWYNREFVNLFTSSFLVMTVRCPDQKHLNCCVTLILHQTHHSPGKLSLGFWMRRQVTTYTKMCKLLCTFP